MALFSTRAARLDTENAFKVGPLIRGLEEAGHRVIKCNLGEPACRPSATTSASDAAFMAPLGHVAARLHAIGAQARQSVAGRAYDPFFLVCAHAGLETGEDGPTHADPQALQMLQGSFPPGTVVTLTPWEPQEMWHLVGAALRERPAVIAPFVTRPNKLVLKRDSTAPTRRRRSAATSRRPGR